MLEWVHMGWSIPTATGRKVLEVDRERTCIRDWRSWWDTKIKLQTYSKCCVRYEQSQPTPRQGLAKTDLGALLPFSPAPRKCSSIPYCESRRNRLDDLFASGIDGKA